MPVTLLAAIHRVGLDGPTRALAYAALVLLAGRLLLDAYRALRPRP